MQWHQYLTITDQYRRAHPEFRGRPDPTDDEIDRVFNGIPDRVVRSAYQRRRLAETVWKDFGKPYCKIEPQMAWEMSNTCVDIPVQELPLCEVESIPSQSVWKMNSFVILFSDAVSSPCGIGSLLFQLMVSRKDGKYLALIHSNFQGKELSSPMHFSPTDKVESVLTKYMGRVEFLPLWRIAICTLFFLHDQHELVMPDLTKKEIVKYRKAKERGDEQRMQQLRQKAGNRNGYIIGRREIDLPVPKLTFTGTPDYQTGTGRELHHAHIRRGHLRRQRIGKRDENKHKLIFLPPTVVRPDLPLADTVKGYRIPDSALE